MNAANKTARRFRSTNWTRRRGRVFSHFLLYLVIVAILAAINAAQTPGAWWVGWPALGLGLALLAVSWRTLVTPYFSRDFRKRRI